MSDLLGFPALGSITDVEEGCTFAPKLDRDGLITCVTTDARSGDVLMVAHMMLRPCIKPSLPGLVFQPFTRAALAQGRELGPRAACRRDAH